MENKKLTDNEIKKALKEILEIMLNMGDLQKSSTISNALDLINRLQAENERLEQNLKEAHIDIREHIAENERLKGEVAKEFTCFVGDPHKVEHCPYLEELKTAKAEAYKEFAERLDNKAMFPQEINDDYAVGLTIIKKTLKELVGKTK